ncbi:hypothetical protein BJ138DRAFT_1117790 [Hygrophoropsis aurantiaca]|uniref:Uncharacterized protein n=1 Tax=Hygrophoropsis aurantiaca TaxID=72124 RepID=A0ACB7ZZS0_9AGAM|nr:hypothetical protein BJ138DRAFT_1117790 [Hygrophoropsis aurantiaca]
MPEYRECLASNKTIQRWFSDVSGKLNLSLLAIWADTTEAERKTIKDPLARAGLVYKIPHTTTIKRGTNGAQKQVYPPGPWSKRVDPRPLTSLVLRGIHASPRNVILDMTEQWLQVQLHTHTLAQIYTRSQWDDSIAKVHCEIRGFRIGMALDFGEYILAFDTLDNIYTPHWAATRDALPGQHVDVYNDYGGFLSAVAAWIDRRQCSKTTVRSNLAVNVIRTDGHLCFGGIGVYTINEVFFLAGLSVFLTEAEVFDDADRTARFCEAFWSFVSITHTKLDALLSPCWQGYVLAATEEQRLKYSYWLHVFGKEITDTLSKCEESAEICVRDGSIGLYDVFEPTYLQTAFRDKDINLGHLIFGYDGWRALGGRVSSADDALTQHFLKHGASSSPPSSNLNHSLYSSDSLNLPPNELRKRRVAPDLYLGTNQKHLWTIIPNFPNCMISPVVSKSKRAATNKGLYCAFPGERKTHIFHYVVKHTRRAAVGPLEYCGIARIIHRQHAGKKEPLISLCRHDPMIPPSYRNRELARIESIAGGRQQKGAAHTKSDSSYGKGGWGKRKHNDEDSGDREENKLPGILTSSPTANGAKRRRVGADAQMTLHSEDFMVTSRLRRRSSASSNVDTLPAIA